MALLYQSRAGTSIAEVSGLARRYPVEVSPLSAIADNQDPQAWCDLATLIGPNGTTVLTGNPLHIPDDWVTLDAGSGVQLLGEDVDGYEDDEALDLGAKDVASRQSDL